MVSDPEYYARPGLYLDEDDHDRLIEDNHEQYLQERRDRLLNELQKVESQLYS